MKRWLDLRTALSHQTAQKNHIISYNPEEMMESFWASCRIRKIQLLLAGEQPAENQKYSEVAVDQFCQSSYSDSSYRSFSALEKKNRASESSQRTRS